MRLCVGLVVLCEELTIRHVKLDAYGNPDPGTLTANGPHSLHGLLSLDSSAAFVLAAPGAGPRLNVGFASVGLDSQSCSE